MKKYYITTPIYYPNGAFHIGTAYTSCLCDSITRYKKQLGYDTFFLTGVDEHGQKIEETAKKLGRTPQAHVDMMADYAKKLWKQLDVNYSDFIRTTEPRHIEVVQEIFEKLLKQDDIYLGEYEGEYCVSCETFYTKTQVGEERICPDCGQPTKLVKEESYFLRMSKYADRLLKYIDEHPDFIQPETKKNEVVAFIKQGLNDLCVSRTSFSWGIPVLSNPRHVVYVWLDALTNYISALNYHKEDDSLYKKYWLDGEVVHVVGKDILRFHAIIWPIILMAIGEPINFKLLVHGWYMMKDGKMSKSKGNVIYPNQIVERYGLDSFRYYIVRELPYGSDGVFTPEDFVGRFNTDLVNDYGNLVNRTIAMVNKYFSGTVSKKFIDSKEITYLENHQAFVKECVKNYHSLMDEYKVALALQEINKIVSRTNKLIDETEPWVLAKDEAKSDVLETVLYQLLEGIRIATSLYEPYLIETAPKVFKALNTDEDNLTDLKEFELSSYTVNPLDGPLFPRLDVKKEVDYLKELMTPKAKKEGKPLIGIEDFEKLELCIGEVLECKKHPNAEKLLVSKIDLGGEVRQIVSGIAQYYTPEDMIGKKVVVLKNLKPVELRGVLSEGMILAGSNKKALEVLSVNNLKSGDNVK